eukprot:6176852-Pleurochrysis_carterae.AAC.2
MRDENTQRRRQRVQALSSTLSACARVSVFFESGKRTKSVRKQGLMRSKYSQHHEFRLVRVNRATQGEEKRTLKVSPPCA